MINDFILNLKQPEMRIPTIFSICYLRSNKVIIKLKTQMHII